MKYKLKAEKANEAQTQQAATELDQSRRHRDDPLRRFRPESPTVYDTSGSVSMTSIDQSGGGKGREEMN
jgi:hypothetical protein